MIVEKEYVVAVPCISTERPMVLEELLLPVSFTCVNSMMVKLYILSPGEQNAFPVVKDLIVDRSAFDRVIQAGGYMSVNTSGNTIDANAVPIPKENADDAFSAATCIGCGACVATCKNSSAMLFVSAKVSQLALLPQGQVEREERVLNMVNQMDLEGFGNCTNTGACEVECPKEISLENIARMNRNALSASIKLKNKRFRLRW